mgnify:CR=1 FL=1
MDELSGARRITWDHLRPARKAEALAASRPAGGGLRAPVSLRKGATREEGEMQGRLAGD